MDKKNLEVLHHSLSENPCKTASALREMLSEREAVAKKNDGTRSARERILSLFDEGTFMELGAYVMRRSSEFEAGKSDDLEAVICGFGSVNGCLVYAFSQDFSRTRGGVSEAQAKKLHDLYRLATENGAPVVGIFDSAGGSACPCRLWSDHEGSFSRVRCGAANRCDSRDCTGCRSNCRRNV